MGCACPLCSRHCLSAGRVSLLAMNDADLPPLPPTPPGLYRHVKGGEYQVLGCVRHSETLEPLVLYRALYGERGLWVRPHAMFFGTVAHAGRQQPRFALVRADPAVQL